MQDATAAAGGAGDMDIASIKEGPGSGNEDGEGNEAQASREALAESLQVNN